MRNKNYLKQIEVFYTIEQKLFKNNLKLRTVLFYQEKKGNLTVPIDYLINPYYLYKKTGTGLSLKRLNMLNDLVDDYLLKPKNKLWLELYEEVRFLVGQNNILLLDLYTTWIQNKNYSIKDLSLMNFNSFQTGFYRTSFNDKGKLSYDRLLELKSVLITMINESYDYEKKTYKRKYSDVDGK